ncbi:MAG TPA: MlaD family protein [Thermoanaerobaculia bacterium]|nr:MlaD family protein [Thermoanaerobaculia bacterium]
MSSAAKVGIFMLIVLGILGFFILRIEDIRWNQAATTKKVQVVFDSVAGLDNKSAVRVAGVRVGKVSDIKLQPDGRALVTLEVDKDVQLRSNASGKIANLGLLGEKYVELDPGSPTAPPIANLDRTVLRGSQPATFDDVTNQIAAISDDVKAITASLRHVMAGPAGQQRLEDIVENVRTVTAQMRALIDANRENVDATTDNMRAITADLRVEIPKIAASIDRVANSMGGTIDENRPDARQIVENLKKLSIDLQTTTANLNSITGQVKSGDGTVGKLVYSNETHEKLNSALSSVESGVKELSSTLGRANRIGLDLDIRSDYLAGLKHDATLGEFQGNSRSAVGIRIAPNPLGNNRFYNIVLADDPRGHRHDRVIEDTVTDPVTGKPTTTITTDTRFDRAFLISAQAGWSLDNVALRIGLFDSTGGVGADYRWNDRIRFTGEAFDFGKRNDSKPHLRLYGEYTLLPERPRTPMLFLSTGVDNALNERAFLFGGGVRWRDDDLKYLLTSVPIK